MLGPQTWDGPQLQACGAKEAEIEATEQGLGNLTGEEGRMRTQHSHAQSGSA